MPTHSATGRSVLVGAALGLLAALVAAPAAAVEAQGVRVDVADAGLLGEGAVLRPAIPPGGSATYDLRLRNQRDQAVEVLVYGADATPEGEVAAGTDNQGVGTWVSAERSLVEVPAQSTAIVDVTIARPADDEDGGTGAIVTQLSDASRRELALARIQRAALLVEVAADGSGDGVHVEVLGTDAGGGLVPSVLAVDVRFTAPGADQDVLFDGSVQLLRPLVEDPTYDAAVDTVSPGEEVLATVEVDLPWYGFLGHAQAQAAAVGLTTRGAPVRVVVLPPWLAVLAVALAGLAVVRARGGGLPRRLGRGPEPAGDPAAVDEAAAAEVGVSDTDGADDDTDPDDADPDDGQ